MNMLTKKQREAIGVLQNAHGAIHVLMDYLRSDAPEWVAQKAHEVVKENIDACKITSALIEDEECENTYVLPMPTAKVWESLKVLMEMPCLLLACHDAIQKEISFPYHQKVERLLNEARSAVPIVRAWMKSEAEIAVGQAVAHVLATGEEFPPQMRWAADEIKKLKEMKS